MRAMYAAIYTTAVEKLPKTIIDSSGGDLQAQKRNKMASGSTEAEHP